MPQPARNLSCSDRAVPGFLTPARKLIPGDPPSVPFSPVALLPLTSITAVTLPQQSPLPAPPSATETHQASPGPGGCAPKAHGAEQTPASAAARNSSRVCTLQPLSPEEEEYTAVRGQSNRTFCSKFHKYPKINPACQGCISGQDGTRDSRPSAWLTKADLGLHPGWERPNAAPREDSNIGRCQKRQEHHVRVLSTSLGRASPQRVVLICQDL